MHGSITFMNKNNICIVCGKCREEQISTNLRINGAPAVVRIPLIKHHVQYDPEIIAHVHFSCHMDIHKGLHPHLLQYQDSESKSHYNKKKPS